LHYLTLINQTLDKQGQGSDNLTMELTFFKYQGAGNDFVMIDNRARVFNGIERELFEQLCHRRFGIGADGLILLQEKEGFDFEMKYYNADGRESTMCGNGGRCVVMFAKQLGIIEVNASFLAIDGPHQAIVLENGNVSLQMGDVSSIGRDSDAYVLNTGSPHYVQQVNDAKGVDVYSKGKAIRNSTSYATEGINVNFVEIIGDGQLKVRTYERGVEDETYACGTGVTASAIAASQMQGLPNGDYEYSIETLGGPLAVKYTFENGTASNIWLTGPAVKVFDGTMRTA
jgi:diaminopimelate epimerase